ncbi:hypothetical protein D9Q98_002740 [Chlorella vulgaris]|uniref:Uncharacterized protein n=1 Tax=Chlorella vulgaris TaxID=3077 RepID=A0A9D4YZQ9_CHLVU|nr:hypothetical protein D9Q98_002740 [Chlorella vulgaris]
MHNGLRTQEALEGTFTRTRFLLVGTDETPCPYTSGELRRDAYGGKQFGIAATRTGKHPTRDFMSAFKPLFEGDVWAESLPYRELQPDKPSAGFLTSDYSKRDEFSLTIRQEQRRQQIRHEARLQKQAEERLAARKQAGRSAPGRGAEAQPGGPRTRKPAPLLWDLVFAESDLCVKSSRDTCNPTRLTRERDVGSWKTTSRIAHCAPPPARPASAAACSLAGPAGSTS